MKDRAKAVLFFGIIFTLIGGLIFILVTEYAEASSKYFNIHYDGRYIGEELTIQFTYGDYWFPSRDFSGLNVTTTIIRGDEVIDEKSGLTNRYGYVAFPFPLIDGQYGTGWYNATTTSSLFNQTQSIFILERHY